jgi:hypothetical protein
MSPGKTDALQTHAIHLGGLLGNLQSLEILLRFFLSNQPDARPRGVPYGIDIFESPVGTLLPVSDITSYDTLGQLIDKLNAYASSTCSPTLDRSLVDIRDALAHGRISAKVPSEKLRLVKYARPDNGQVRVLFNVEMSESWLIDQKRRVYDAMQIVSTHMPP